jgi:hypothetical protein
MAAQVREDQVRRSIAILAEWGPLKKQRRTSRAVFAIDTRPSRQRAAQKVRVRMQTGPYTTMGDRVR